MRQTRQTTKEHLLAWGCPARYARDYPQPMTDAHSAERRIVAAATNWYHQHDRALSAMVAAQDSGAIRAWAASHRWDTLAVRTSAAFLDDDRDANAYTEEVRHALEALADAIEIEGRRP